ncbi:hypothetical protein [Litorisediminicola beolgyonensis]|uniref:Heme exporter protein D n=1 Tax=Litorisediminicola beolgyonensis TaxID=1173614 RepID=A0ABW3ZKG6_9RHOB
MEYTYIIPIVTLIALLSLTVARASVNLRRWAKIMQADEGDR